MVERDSTTGCLVTLVPVDAVLHATNGILGPILSINVALNDFVTKSTQGSLSQGVDGKIRGTHVCWVVAQDVHEGGLQLCHLRLDISLGKRSKIRVVPCVRGDLMSSGNDVLESVIVIVNAIPIQAVLEKCSMYASGIELVNDILCVDVWTIIKSQCNDTWRRAFLIDCASYNSLLVLVRMSQSQTGDAGSDEEILEGAHIKVLYRTKKLTNEY